ncbi:Na-Ca exchanger/integrin-beta4 [uncultured Mediterranean phage uvMED]|nr:Na-Ca exchanger/integrin-beta4 [uncultured Mediterranean phage uvMED]BAQ93338.1 Na-Ca exchanger/integrin-beta4 [uncultured Mediterranean phage uvMED]BAQ93360.1 Na-Ca exchanger/integrin-beta4 [uncultured Mediterranean phage uvMED]BAR24607.1 Na-Ca exchanger/integrin-beta4 [uncultured Mediterranean phage uvMED]
MGYYLGSRALPMDRPWKTETAQYPANWLRLSSTADRAAIGVTWGADDPVYDQRFYWNVSTPKQLDDKTETVDGVETTSTGLKTLWKSTQNQIAGTLIAPSDWRIIKAKETSTNIPSTWKTYRAAVRTSCNTRQTEIDACTTVEALKELLFGSATITRQKTDADGKGIVEPDTIVDDDANEVANPVAGQPVMETVANPNIATAWPTEPS